MALFFFPLAKLCWPVFSYQLFLICFSVVIITWFGLLSLSLTSAKSLSLDLKVFAGSLTVIRSGESIKTAGIDWEPKTRSWESALIHGQSKQNKKKADLRWLGSALPYPPLCQIRTLISPQSGIPVWSGGEFTGEGGLAWRLLDVSVCGPKGASCDESQGFYNLKHWQASSPSIRGSRVSFLCFIQANFHTVTADVC